MLPVAVEASGVGSFARVSGRLRRHVRTFFGYGAVSVAALCIELTILQLLLLEHMPQPWAVSLAFLSACVFQFLVLRYIVFEVRHRPIVFQANAYVVAAAFSWLAVLASVTLLTTVFGISTMAARAISIPLLFPMNYMINRNFIFRR